MLTSHPIVQAFTKSYARVREEVQKRLGSEYAGICVRRLAAMSESEFIKHAAREIMQHDMCRREARERWLLLEPVCHVGGAVSAAGILAHPNIPELRKLLARESKWQALQQVCQSIAGMTWPVWQKEVCQLGALFLQKQGVTIEFSYVPLRNYLYPDTGRAQVLFQIIHRARLADVTSNLEEVYTVFTRASGQGLAETDATLLAYAVHGGNRELELLVPGVGMVSSPIVVKQAGNSPRPGLSYAHQPTQPRAKGSAHGPDYPPDRIDVPREYPESSHRPGY